MDDTIIMGPWSPPGEDGPSATPPLSLIQSSVEFTRNFVPPDYLIDGILQRRFCYSLTAKTGTGKTAIMLRVPPTSHLADRSAVSRSSKVGCSTSQARIRTTTG
jgi:hypothetical protein